jgi:hypothetical protein
MLSGRPKHAVAAKAGVKGIDSDLEQEVGFLLQLERELRLPPFWG